MIPRILFDAFAFITTFILIAKLINDDYISTFWGIIFLSTLLLIIIYARLKGDEISHWVRTLFRILIPVISLLLLTIITTSGDTHNTIILFIILLYFVALIFLLYLLFFAFSPRKDYHPRMLFFDLILIISTTALILSAIMKGIISEEIGVIILLIIIVCNAAGHMIGGRKGQLVSMILRFGIPVLSLLFLLFSNGILSIDILSEFFVTCFFIYVAYKILSGFFSSKSI